MTKKSDSKTATRRKFLMAAGATAAATVTAPSVQAQQGPISMRWQSTWPSKDIFHEYANRLRQEGQRHDRRRPQDRGAARRRRGAGVPVARRGLQGRARRRSRRAGLSLRQADRAGAVGLRPGLRRWTPTCCCPGTSTAAARSCSTRSSPRSAPTSCRSRTGRCRPSRSAGTRSRSPRSTTSRASSSAPSASRLTCSPAWAPRSTRCPAAKSSRRWIAACSMRPSSTTPRPTASSALPTSPRS